MADQGLQPHTVTLDHLHRFAYTLIDLGISPVSVCRILSGVRSWFHYLLSQGIITADPTEMLEMPRRPAHLPTVLTVDEVDALEAAIDLSEPTGHRDRAIIELLYSCGLRVSELCSLTLADVYTADAFLNVIGKGSKQRFVPMSPRAVRELQFWLDDRCHITPKPGEDDYLFLSFRRRQHLSRITVFHTIQVLAARAGITRPISPTPCATPSPPTSSRAVPTSEPYKPCSATKAYAPPSSTPTSTASSCASNSKSTCHVRCNGLRLICSVTCLGSR